jgi:hypothetical protein
MGTLANSLILVIISISLILILPIIRWVYQYYRIIKRVNLDDKWLDDPKSRKITYGQTSFGKAVVHGLQNFSRVKKILIPFLISILFISIAWLQ